MDIFGDIILILCFLAVVAAISQLRFSRYQIARTLMWSFLITLAGVLIMQTMKSDLYFDSKGFLDALFWTLAAGLAGAYLWLKKFSRATKE